MPYIPNADDLMPEDELERESRRVLDEMQAIHKMLFDVKSNEGRLPVGAEREVLHKEYEELDRRSHQLNAARGRRTYKREHGTWPDLD